MWRQKIPVSNFLNVFRQVPERLLPFSTELVAHWEYFSFSLKGLILVQLDELFHYDIHIMTKNHYIHLFYYKDSKSMVLNPGCTVTWNPNPAGIVLNAELNYVR